MDDDEIPLVDLDGDMEMMLGFSPAFEILNLLSSLQIQNHQVQLPVLPQCPSPGDNEDDLLESLVWLHEGTPQPLSTPPTLELVRGLPKPNKKQCRADDDDDELLECLASKSK